MFKNNFQITSIVTIIFLMLTLCFMMFIFFALERLANGDRWEVPKTDDWLIILGGFSLFFVITLGLFFRIDLTRKFIQGVSCLMILGWCVGAFFVFKEFNMGMRHRFDRDFFLFIGFSIAFLSYMIGLFTLFGNRVVKEEFVKKSVK